MVLDTASALARADVRQLLAADGHYVSTTPRFPQIIVDTVLNFTGGRKKQVLMLKLANDDLAWLVGQLASKAITVEVERRYPLVAAAEALMHSRAGHVQGKLVIELP